MGEQRQMRAAMGLVLNLNVYVQCAVCFEGWGVCVVGAAK